MSVDIESKKVTTKHDRKEGTLLKLLCLDHVMQNANLINLIPTKQIPIG